MRIKGELLHIIGEMPCQKIYCLRYHRNNDTDKIFKNFKQVISRRNISRELTLGTVIVTTRHE